MSDIGSKTRQRRFEELPAANPEAVNELGDDHPAIIRATTMFEKSIESAETSDNLFISGANNRKIGRVIIKGAWRGFQMFTLTLVERKTCPSSCHMYRSCYGNAMPFARRHAPGAALEARIERDIAALAREHPGGFVVRLHVLGDFYSVAYAELWMRLLARHTALHVYGYTAVGGSADATHVDIATVIDAMNDEFPERCCIRASADEPLPMGAIVLNRAPESANVPEGLVCPAERDATACCATCGMCWEKSTRQKTIVFVRHGFGSRSADRIARHANSTAEHKVRRIAALPALAKVAGPLANVPPLLMWVDPTDLFVDEHYQRHLTRTSVKLIMRIVGGWNWTHFKPPIVVKSVDGRLDVIDGQHTAIAAATHPQIDKIPVMIVSADDAAKRGRAFIAHNHDRVAVSPLQLHRSAVAAGDALALTINDVSDRAGVTILVMPPPVYQPGQTTALGAIKSIVRKYGQDRAVETLQALAGRSPLRADEIKGVAMVMWTAPGLPAAVVQRISGRHGYHDIEQRAKALMADTGEPLHSAITLVYAQLALEAAA